MTIEDVAAAIRVRADFVAALESMNINLLPGKAYAKAYLRSYTKLLDLPEEEIVAQYERESALLREDTGEQIRNPHSKPREERPWLAAAALGVVCVAFVGWQAVQSLRPPEPEAQIALDASPGPSTASPNTIAPGARGEAGDDPWGLAAQVVEIEAVADGWLEVRGPDGTIFLSRDMRPGERYRPDVGANWTLHAEDGGVFQVHLNGAPIGLLGPPQSPVLGRGVDAIAKAALGEG
jgi:hypothetical protein